MLQELLNKQLDIYIALVVGLICTVVGLVLDRFLKARRRRPEEEETVPTSTGLSMTQVTQISVKVGQQSMATGAEGLMGLGIAAICVAYLWYRSEILLTGMLLTLVMVGLWLGVALHSIYAGYLRGWQWPAYLLSMVAFATGAVAVLAAASAPAKAPAYFDQWQQYVQNYGVVGLLKLIQATDLIGLGWLVVHVAGVAAFFIALRDAAMSMFFYAAASSGRLLESGNENSWIVRAAARYARPFRTLASLAILLIAAYYLVSGEFFYWLVNEFPILVQAVVKQIMFGRRGQ